MLIQKANTLKNKKKGSRAKATMKPYGSSHVKIFGQVDVNLENTVHLLQTNGVKVTVRDEEPVRMTIPISLGRGKENDPNQKWDEAVIMQKLRNRKFMGGMRWGYCNMVGVRVHRGSRLIYVDTWTLLTVMRRRFGLRR